MTEKERQIVLMLADLVLSDMHKIKENVEINNIEILDSETAFASEVLVERVNTI